MTQLVSFENRFIHNIKPFLTFKTIKKAVKFLERCVRLKVVVRIVQ